MENILGNRLPVELQRKISLYMEHATAEMIKNYMEEARQDVEEYYVKKDILDDCITGAVRTTYEREKDREKWEEDLKIENLVKSKLQKTSPLCSRVYHDTHYTYKFYEWRNPIYGGSGGVDYSGITYKFYKWFRFREVV